MDFMPGEVALPPQFFFFSLFFPADEQKRVKSSDKETMTDEEREKQEEWSLWRGRRMMKGWRAEESEGKRME